MFRWGSIFPTQKAYIIKKTNNGLKTYYFFVEMAQLVRRRTANPIIFLITWVRIPLSTSEIFFFNTFIVLRKIFCRFFWGKTSKAGSPPRMWGCLVFWSLFRRVFFKFFAFGKFFFGYEHEKTSKRSRPVDFEDAHLTARCSVNGWVFGLGGKFRKKAPLS